MIVIIKRIDWTPVTQFRSFKAGRIKKVLSGIGQTTFTIPLNEPNLEEAAVKILNRVEVIIEGSLFWAWIVTNIRVNPDWIQYTCVDWIGFSQYRNNRGLISYWALQQNDALSQFYGEVNTKYPLPFTLGQNDITDTISIEGPIWRTFYDFLESLRGKNWEYRSIWNQIDFGYQVGTDNWWLLRYDANSVISSNIISWERDLSIDDFFNGLISRNKREATEYLVTEDSASIATNWLIDAFVLSPDAQQTKLKPEFIRVPSIVIDGRSINRTKTNVWDIFRVYLWLKPSFLSLEFVWKVKSIEVVINWWRYDPIVEIESDDTKIKGIGKLMENIYKNINDLATN